MALSQDAGSSTGNPRVDALLARMTLAEKLTLIHDGREAEQNGVVIGREARGIQSQHVMAVAKHLIAYDTAGTDVWLDEQTLHEVYLAPFEAATQAGAALPLKRADLGSVVLIGPTAGQVDAIGINGERSMGLPARQLGPLAALKRISGNSRVEYAVDDDMTGTTVPASVLSHAGSPGLERASARGRRIDAELNFTVARGNALLPYRRPIWTGTLTVATGGSYWLYLQALGTDAGLFIDGRRVGVTGTFQGDVHGDILQANQDNAIPTTDGLDNVRHAVELAAGCEARQDRRGPRVGAPLPGVRAAGRSELVGERSVRGQSEHHSRAQYQPTRRAPLG